MVFHRPCIRHGGEDHYPQSNGMAERTVKTVKGLLKESSDPHLAVLSYRATPLPWCNRSPAELLMGRKLRTDLPTTTASLTPQWEYPPEFKAKDRERKMMYKQDFDRRQWHDLCQTSPMTLQYGSQQEESLLLDERSVTPLPHDHTTWRYQMGLYVGIAGRSIRTQMTKRTKHNPQLQQHATPS